MKSIIRFGAAVMLAMAGAAQAQNISIATGGTGGVYYPLGGGLAAVLSKYVPGMQATAEVTGGSVANMQLVGTGKSYIAFTQADAAIDALKGQDKFAGKPIPVRTLAVLYPNRMHVVSIEGTGITKMADMKGKRVSTGSGGSATEVFAFRVIEAAGLDKDKDMKRERLGVAESVNALKDRKIDAFFWVGGLPTAAVTDLANSPGVKIKMIDIAHLVPEMAKKHGSIYIKDVIPQRTYKGMEADNQAATVTNLLAVHADMDQKTAYTIIKTMWEHRVDLVRVHAEALALHVLVLVQARRLDDAEPHHFGGAAARAGGDALALQVRHLGDAGALDRHHVHAVRVQHHERARGNRFAGELVFALDRVDRRIGLGQGDVGLAGADQLQVGDRAAGDLCGRLHAGYILRQHRGHATAEREIDAARAAGGDGQVLRLRGAGKRQQQREGHANR